MNTSRIVLRRGSLQPTPAQVKRIRADVERLRQNDIIVYHVYVDKDSFHIEEIDRMFFWNEADVPPRPKPTIVIDKYSYSVECPDCGERLDGTNKTRGTSVAFTRRCPRCKSIVRVTLTRDADGWDADAEKIVPRFIAKGED